MQRNTNTETSCYLCFKPLTFTAYTFNQIYNKPMKKLLLSAVALGLLFTACKDDETNPTPEQTSMKLWATSISATDKISIQYNADRQISLYQLEMLDENSSLFIKPIYENNRITSLLAGSTANDITNKAMTYKYNDAGKVLSVDFYDDSDGSLNQFDSVAYNAAGRVAAVYYAEKTSAEKHLGFYKKTVFEWDAKGNVTRQHKISIVDGKESTDTTTTVYTYDDKVNHIAKQADFYLFDVEEVASELSANNIVKEETVSGDYKYLDTATYTYDADNYPVTRNSTYKIFGPDGKETYSRTESATLTYIRK